MTEDTFMWLRSVWEGMVGWTQNERALAPFLFHFSRCQYSVHLEGINFEFAVEILSSVKFSSSVVGEYSLWFDFHETSTLVSVCLGWCSGSRLFSLPWFHRRPWVSNLLSLFFCDVKVTYDFSLYTPSHPCMKSIVRSRVIHSHLFVDPSRRWAVRNGVWLHSSHPLFYFLFQKLRTFWSTNTFFCMCCGRLVSA